MRQHLLAEPSECDGRISFAASAEFSHAKVQNVV